MSTLFQTPDQLAAGDSPDTIGYAPLGGMVIDAAGHVTYDFAGHIHAKGLDLDVGSGPAESIRWLRPDGTAGATLTDTSAGGLDQLNIGVDAAAGNRATASLGATDGSELALLALTANDAGLSFASITVNTIVAVLMDENRASDFVRRAAPRQPFVINGDPYTVDSGALAAGAISTVALTHNLGKTAYPWASHLDSNFGLDIGWQFTRTSTNTMTFAFRNLGPNPAARLILEVFLITLS